MFGDPSASKQEYPVQSLQIGVNIELPTRDPSTHVVHEPTQDVICDFVDGWAFGNALGIGMRSVDGWWTVKEVTLEDSNPDNVTHLYYARNKKQVTHTVCFDPADSKGRHLASQARNTFGALSNQNHTNIH